jgi:hypothetical protein
MNLKKVLIGVAVVIVGVVAYYGLSPLFRTVKVNESLPVDTASGATQQMQVLAETKGHAIVGAATHPASGEVRIIKADGKQYIRYENFKTINGPDIFVYLAKDLDAKDFVNIGPVKATEGNVNYEIPQDVNPDEYKYVMVWVRQDARVYFHFFLFGFFFQSFKFLFVFSKFYFFIHSIYFNLSCCNIILI